MKNDTEIDENIQLAENENVEYDAPTHAEYEEKRRLLEKTKITKQTWSIVEIFQKIKEKKLIVDTDYQRNVIWNDDKKTSFIESLFMEIMIPPIYVVEIPGDDFLSENQYEVVDGKQRLSTITDFLKGNLKLDEKSLEYYRDIFGSKNFYEIKDSESERITQMLSYVLDVYVITANSPESTKYDIFARLNKGAEKLKVNEIRRAIYHSETTRAITEFVDARVSEDAQEDLKKEYDCIFSLNDKKRFEDYGRFYRSIAFYIKSDFESKKVVDYNSRPREMINSVLQDLQEKKLNLEISEVTRILEKTIELSKVLKKNKHCDYIIDACIPFVKSDWEKLMEKLKIIIADKNFEDTFIKSPATTSNVNKRLEIVLKYLKGDIL
jgi:hypothetical protein